MTSPFLMRIPSSAPRPMPTATAVGVARPSAQGQATTTTEMKTVAAKSGVAFSRKYQTHAETVAMSRTAGMKYETAVSAIL